mgnify:CR=1 FL=1
MSLNDFKMVSLKDKIIEQAEKAKEEAIEEENKKKKGRKSKEIKEKNYGKKK